MLLYRSLPFVANPRNSIQAYTNARTTSISQCIAMTRLPYCFSEFLIAMIFPFLLSPLRTARIDARPDQRVLR
ncbi:hypothetical protein D3C85_812060 [compost metagenome]